MQTPDALRTALRAISGRDYPAYRSLLGTYDFGHFILDLDHIQKDPFAAPTRARLRVAQRVAGFPSRFLSSAASRRATADWIARRAAIVLEGILETAKRGGALSVDVGGQEVLARTAVVISPETLELRLNMSLPGEGRTVLTDEAERLLFHAIPTLCREALLFDGKTSDLLRRHVEAVEDQAHLRSILPELGLVAFIGDGAVLPRESTTSDMPMGPDRVVPVTAPRELRVTVELPHAGRVSGLGIPTGVTAIVGGGFQGKSTLVQAVQMGVYDHIPGDGRELVVTEPSAVRVRAEEGRHVVGLDLRAFLRSLPDGAEVSRYTTDSAPAGVSQAANLVEALEAGAGVILIDEDDSAAAFLATDPRVRALTGRRREPVIPLAERVRSLHDLLNVSTIVATGVAGDFIAAADTVLMMDRCRPRVVTKQARDVVSDYPEAPQAERAPRQLSIKARVPQPSTINARRGRKAAKVSARGRSTIFFGQHDIDMSRVAGIVDPSQLRAIGDALEYAVRQGIIDGRRTVREVAEAVADAIEREGLDCISPHFGRHPGDYAQFRSIELAAALCRLPTVDVDEGSEEVDRPLEPQGEAPHEGLSAAAPTTEEHGTRSGRRRRRGRRSRRSSSTGPEGGGTPQSSADEPRAEAGLGAEPQLTKALDAVPDGEIEPLQTPPTPQTDRSHRRNQGMHRLGPVEAESRASTPMEEETEESTLELGGPAVPIPPQQPIAPSDTVNGSRTSKPRRLPRRGAGVAVEAVSTEATEDAVIPPQTASSERPGSRRVPRRPVTLSPPDADMPRAAPVDDPPVPKKPRVRRARRKGVQEAPENGSGRRSAATAEDAAGTESGPGASANAAAHSSRKKAPSRSPKRTPSDASAEA